AGAAERDQRLGRGLPEVPPGSLWIHGASVGEARLVAALAGAWRRRTPRPPLALSAVTATRRALLPGPPRARAPFLPPPHLPPPRLPRRAAPRLRRDPARGRRPGRDRALAEPRLGGGRARGPGRAGQCPSRPGALREIPATPVPLRSDPGLARPRRPRERARS